MDELPELPILKDRSKEQWSDLYSSDRQRFDRTDGSCLAYRCRVDGPVWFAIQNLDLQSADISVWTPPPLDDYERNQMRRLLWRRRISGNDGFYFDPTTDPIHHHKGGEPMDLIIGLSPKSEIRAIMPFFTELSPIQRSPSICALVSALDARGQTPPPTLLTSTDYLYQRLAFFEHLGYVLDCNQCSAYDGNVLARFTHTQTRVTTDEYFFTRDLIMHGAQPLMYYARDHIQRYHRRFG